MWDIGKLNPQKHPNLKGSLSLQSGAPKPEENPNLNIDLKIQQLAISGSLWHLYEAALVKYCQQGHGKNVHFLIFILLF